MSALAIIGGGSWGTALSIVLAPRFEDVRLWIHEPELAKQVQNTRLNSAFLPDFALPEQILVTNSLPVALSGADFVVSVMPSHVVAEVYARMQPSLLPDARIVSASKGLEEHSLRRISEVIESILGRPAAVLSGPSFAREVVAGNPTAVVLASQHVESARQIQKRFSGSTFRIYLSDDPVGVEIGGALKNVIAIGAGICDGLALGHNAVAALITRGLAELTRLAVALGGKPETLAGLAGLGDLVLTCTGDLSRNRQVGLRLAQGMNLGQIVAGTPMVAEGIRTTSVAMDLAQRTGVDLPIVAEMHAVLHLGRSPADAIQRLMSRTLRSERE